jgi:DNA-binding transcriptional LysR family regulator
MEIDLRLLRSFVALHELGSVSRAAERLCCTQQAMSMRLKMLETEIGAPLFLRRPGGLEPTAGGASLYARALTVLSAYDEMMSATRARARTERLRLGLPDDYAAGWLDGLIAGLGADFARTELEVRCDLSARLMAAVQAGDLDLALVTLEARPARALVSVELPLLWLGAPGAAAAEVALAAYPEGCVFRRAMTRALDAAGRPWRVALQSQSRAGIMAAVRSGRAVTAVAAGTAPAGMTPRAALADLPVLPPVTLHLVTAEGARPAARRVAGALAQALGRMAEAAA